MHSQTYLTSKLALKTIFHTTKQHILLIDLKTIVKIVLFLYARLIFLKQIRYIIHILR